jgi:hypothetical protein
MEYKHHFKELFLKWVSLFDCLSGIFFGLFSCGGYIWHTQLFYLVVSVLLLATLAYPASFIDKWYKKLAFLVLLGIVYFLFQAVAGAFYPSSPNSFIDFMQSFKRNLVYGVC